MGFGDKPCEDCGSSTDYCSECSTCHACLGQSRISNEAKLSQILSQRDELLEVVKAMRQWIDAVPSNTPLPAMPGFDRDWADSVIDQNSNK